MIGKLLIVSVACWLTARAFAESWSWGMSVLLLPLCFVYLEMWVGPLLAAGLLCCIQLYFIRQHWRDVSPLYLSSLVLFFIGALLVQNGVRGMLP